MILPLIVRAKRNGLPGHWSVWLPRCGSCNQEQVVHVEGPR